MAKCLENCDCKRHDPEVRARLADVARAQVQRIPLPIAVPCSPGCNCGRHRNGSSRCKEKCECGRHSSVSNVPCLSNCQCGKHSLTFREGARQRALRQPRRYCELGCDCWRHAPEFAAKISKTLTGTTLPIEVKRKISVTMKSWCGALTPEQRRERHLAMKSPTSLERMVSQELDRLGIQYIQEQPFRMFLADFFLPDYFLVIECDGAYWHSNTQERDSRKDCYIESQGISVVRLTETEIKRDPQAAVEKALS